MDKSIQHSPSKHKNIRKEKAKYVSDLWIEKPFLRLKSIKKKTLKENMELTT